jgi:hypothetical protein
MKDRTFLAYKFIHRRRRTEFRAESLGLGHVLHEISSISSVPGALFGRTNKGNEKLQLTFTHVY